MRQLLPHPVDPVDPVDVYGELPPSSADRPGVRLNMIASMDGATTVAGLSGGLGNQADRDLFALLRSLADVVLVGAGTVRAEHYRPSRVPIAVVTRSCFLDWESEFFTAPIARPVVITVAEAPERNREKAASVADLIVSGTRDVDLSEALRELRSRGHRSVLGEGGPTLNGRLSAAGLIDELCLTVSPRLVGGHGKRILEGPPVAPRDFGLRSVCEQDGFLFLRYRGSHERTVS